MTPVLKHSPFDALTSIEVEFLLRWFFYYMPMEQRLKLMEEHPVLYNKICGEDVMEVKQRALKEAS